MSDNTLKHIVATVIALLLIFQIGTLIAGLLGLVWGVLAALIVTAISFFSTRLAGAGAKSSLWFLLPTLLFTVIPVVIMVSATFSREAGWVDRFAALAPFVIGFALPVLLLLVVHYELRKRTAVLQPRI